MKKYLGKTVFLRGTGNNKRESTSAELIKVGRVNVEFKVTGHNHAQKMRFSFNDAENRFQLCGMNCGYEVYESLLDMGNQVRLERAAAKISNLARNQYELLRR